MSENQPIWVQNVWYGSSPIRWLLLPLSWLFALIVFIRRAMYKSGIIRSHALSVPVIVVGNISVGGTGKTPVALWLATELHSQGFRPGIVTRGYRGDVGSKPVLVESASSPEKVGDEAVLLATHCEGPVVVHPDRVAAARKAIKAGADIIVCDDGLQHYRLNRDVEIAVVDSARGFGNGHLLPAGPLRERRSRLAETDEVLVQGGCVVDLGDVVDAREFALEISAIFRLDNAETRPIESLAGSTVHAIAGIGNPERFFLQLESLGIEVIRHPLADHARIAETDLVFDDDLAIVMTEKDAVKCRSFTSNNCWYAKAEIAIRASDRDAILSKLLNKFSQRHST